MTPIDGRRRTRRGYTLVEVMMAIGVMAVGSLGVLSLHKATTDGTRAAREMTIANELTAMWLDRLREDALRWNARGPGGLGNTRYLVNSPAGVLVAGAWSAPAQFPGRSFGADYFGNDTAVAGNMRYCSNIRMEWLGGQDALRVDVRTWWHRTGSRDAESVNLAQFQGCAAGNVAGVTAELASASPVLKAVYGSTVVRWTGP